VWHRQRPICPRPRRRPLRVTAWPSRPPGFERPHDTGRQRTHLQPASFHPTAIPARAIGFERNGNVTSPFRRLRGTRSSSARECLLGRPNPDPGRKSSRAGPLKALADLLSGQADRSVERSSGHPKKTASRRGRYAKKPAGLDVPPTAGAPSSRFEPRTAQGGEGTVHRGWNKIREKRRGIKQKKGAR